MEATRIKQRDFRRKKLLEGIWAGRDQITQQNYTLFLEAICNEPDVVGCGTKITSDNGGQALQQAMRMSSTPEFLNNQGRALLLYLQSPDLRQVYGGELLKQILTKIADPPLFLNVLKDTFLGGELTNEAQSAFGWLLIQLCGIQGDQAGQYRAIPELPSICERLLHSSDANVRTTGQKLKHMLDTCAVPNGPGAGGRHNNDFPDFRKISILPTTDELESSEPAFIRTVDFLEDTSTKDQRIALHLDNQFRLLREDMIYEMREELQMATGNLKKNPKGPLRNVRLHGLQLRGIECGPENKRSKWSLVVASHTDIPQLLKKDGLKARKEYLLDHRNIFKHQSLACLTAGNRIIGFPTINRDEDLLAKNPPEIVLQFEGLESISTCLQQLKRGSDIKLIQIDTALFSYDPILKGLQRATTLPLSSQLLLWTKGSEIQEVGDQADGVVRDLRQQGGGNLTKILDTPKPIKLDPSQSASLLSGLTQSVTLVQGPPGTGKSFIGALIAKAIHLYTNRTILVVCYTNHALDDILEGLLDIGIPDTEMLRLGGKSTSRTEPLLLHNQLKGSGKRTRDQWTVIDRAKQTAEVLQRRLGDAFNEYKNFRLDWDLILDYLEYEYPDYYAAFELPESTDGMIMVDRKGKGADPTYLIQRWRAGWDAGIYKPRIQEESFKIWNMDKASRLEMWNKWEDALLHDTIVQFGDAAIDYDRCIESLFRAQNTGIASLLQSKRIVGCTTTAAAKYSEDIRTFNPDVLLVEEAGEILESHVLTSLGPNTSQLILIGDHKQLRPKVNNYELTVEKGKGYDLNRSLFERLILYDYPHECLTQQHRMRPEISSLVRNLTYPELLDAPGTLNRPPTLGLRDNVIFIDHNVLEDEISEVADRRDEASTSSKQNSFEVQMILKTIKYLGQQGYRTSDIVILTPYLGQLYKLRDALKEDNDPVLNDLDSHDLVNAGLLNPAEAKLNKKPIRLATIDNYQGEESDIVIVSLTRSNTRGDIGFMASPERVNVLLSRARNAMIMLGNANTFSKARNPEGRKLWTKLFELLRGGNHFYEGLPVQCPRHDDRVEDLKIPEDFDLHCPDGGCNAPCGALLSCNMHKCSSKCHQIYDHSKMKCLVPVKIPCPNGHLQHWQCGEGPPAQCSKCDREARLAKKKQQDEADAQKRREDEHRAHLARMDKLDADIVKEHQRLEDKRIKEDQAAAVKQKELDLEALRASGKNTAAPKISSQTLPPAQQPPVPPQQVTPSTPNPAITMDGSDGTVPPPSSRLSKTDGQDRVTPASKSSRHSPLAPPPINKPPPVTPTPKPFPPLLPSPSKTEWTRQKTLEGSTNPSLDTIMSMTGLESVKQQFLRFKGKIETSLRQGASIKQERFNIVFLGNPGTGKTTVARLFAQFLASMKAVPSDTFIETTGSRLSSEGTDTLKKTLSTLSQSGGFFFIDEAYQLTSGHNAGGGAVLDFLLAEMENQVGNIIFILAGYNREMEKFFEHNPGLKSRVPYQLQFADYEDQELLAIFLSVVEKTYNGRMKIEGGPDGLYMRIMIRRLGRKRNATGFGNARDVQGLHSKVRERQAERLIRERSQGSQPNDYLFTAEDLIGPDPSKAIRKIKAWEKLQSLIGLKAVKESVDSFFALIQENYHRELTEQEPVNVSLNRVFLGSPGTGKTTVAKLYGEILAGLGLLSSGEVIVKNPADFVGAVLGASEANTKAILSNAVGKVLIIDEAYMLYEGGSQTSPFKTTVIDTIVAEVQSVPGEDRCVLLLGYRDQMNEMFQNVNPGLARRFKIEDAFDFEDFNDTELLKILELKLKDQDLAATDEAKKVALDVLKQMRNRPNFGNAGEVENIISGAKTRCVARRAKLPFHERSPMIMFEPQDVDPNFNRTENASANLDKLFEDVVGCDEIVQKLRNYQQIAETCRARDMDAREQIPTNFVFTGPPGTGKTTVARKIGKVFYDMGILGSPEVVECSATDLVGQYVGQTGPKTKKLLEKALGKVLFVDEAYRLGQGHFAQEAVDELVGLITQTTFKNKLVIILAGYEQDMNQLMKVNTGLSSRFPEQVVFYNMDARDCLEVIRKLLEKSNVHFAELEDPNSMDYKVMRGLVEDLAELPDWGNARDMTTLGKNLINKALLKADKGGSGLIKLCADDGLQVLKEMVADRERRSQIPKKGKRESILPEQTLTPNPPTPPSFNISTSTAPPATPPAANTGTGQRDPGVDDATWNALQAAIKAEQLAEQQRRRELSSLENKRKDHEKNEKAAQDLQKKLAEDETKEQDAKKRAAIQREREQARLKQIRAQAEREKAEAALRAKREAERKAKEEEARIQRKLKEMGICPAGYRWIPMGSVYRCSAGGHIVPLSALQ